MPVLLCHVANPQHLFLPISPPIYLPVGTQQARVRLEIFVAGTRFGLFRAAGASPIFPANLDDEWSSWWVRPSSPEDPPPI